MSMYFEVKPSNCGIGECLNQMSSNNLVLICGGNGLINATFNSVRLHRFDDVLFNFYGPNNDTMTLPFELFMF